VNPHACAASSLVGELIAYGGDDGYVARDLLAHERLRTMFSRRHIQHLGDVVAASGLDAGSIPNDLLADLRDALAMTETFIRCCAADPRSVTG